MNPGNKVTFILKSRNAHNKIIILFSQLNKFCSHNLTTQKSLNSEYIALKYYIATQASKLLFSLTTPMLKLLLGFTSPRIIIISGCVVVSIVSNIYLSL